MRSFRTVCALLIGGLSGCSCGGSSAGGASDPDAPFDGGRGDGGTDGSAPDGGEPDGALDGRAADGPVLDAGETPDAGLARTGRVRISELVLTPQHDWSDSTGVGYDPTPGTGAINTRDELIELVNEDVMPIDLDGWRLELIDSEPSTLVIDATLVAIYFTPGSSLHALQPGGLVVLGDPPDSFSTDAFVQLFDSSGALADDVEVGGNSLARDMEGDGASDGAPAAGKNGFTRGAFDEAIARPDGRPDTDVDQADWVAMRATPGAPNLPEVLPADLIAPLVVATSSGVAFQVTTQLRVELSEAIAPSSVDASGIVTVSNGGADVPLGFHTFEADDRVLVINPIGRLPFDADLSVRVAGGPGGLTDRAGNPLGADVVFTVHTEAAPADPGRVRLNELAISPLVDWSDTVGGNGVPFDGVPGTDPATSADEWIELLVAGTAPVDLRTWTIVAYTGPSTLQPSRAVTRLGDATVRVVGTGTGVADARPGDHVVIGNPSGALLPSCWLELRDATGALVDVVEVGGNALGSDRGGDGVSNGAPDPGLDGSSTTAVDETVARIPETLDTGDDVLDWAHAAATPGAPN